MTCPEPATLWLPSTEQIRAAPERAILAALDANLELTIRSLKAEHAALGLNRQPATDPNDEPHTFTLLPIAQQLVLGAKRLRQLVTEYRTAVADLLREDEGTSEPSDPIADVTDQDIPF